MILMSNHCIIISSICTKGLIGYVFFFQLTEKKNIHDEKITLEADEEPYEII